MSIREAIERRQIGKESAGQSQGTLRPFDDRGYVESDYRKMVLDKGLSILGEAGVPKLLAELAEIIRPDFLDVKINDVVVIANGIVSSGIKWNCRDSSATDTIPLKYRYNEIEIIAQPLTEDLVVRGKEELSVFSKSQWSSDPQPLEDAIVRAYRNPISMAGPSVRL